MLDKKTGEALTYIKFLGHRREERSVREMVRHHGASKNGRVDHIRFCIALSKPVSVSS